MAVVVVIVEYKRWDSEKENVGKDTTAGRSGLGEIGVEVHLLEATQGHPKRQRTKDRTHLEAGQDAEYYSHLVDVEDNQG